MWNSCCFSKGFDREIEEEAILQWAEDSCEEELKTKSVLLQVWCEQK